MTEKALLASSSKVSKLAKILNQAERAEEGSPEREAFMAKAMELSQAYAIDLAVARAHQADKEKREEPERRTFQVGEYGRRKQGANAHFVDLMIAICDANDIEVVIGGGNVSVYGTGMPSDLDTAERLFALLSVQMVAEADAGLKRGDHGEIVRVQKRQRVTIPEDERAWGEQDPNTRNPYSDSSYYDEHDELIEDFGNGPVRRRNHEWVKSFPPPTTRLEPVYEDDGYTPVMEDRWVSMTNAKVWRANFYQGFTLRTRMRLNEAKKQALKDAGVDMDDTENDKALALVDKKKEVRSAFEENERFVLSHGGTYTGASTSRYDVGGQLAGDHAGQRARLGNEKDLNRAN